MARNREITRTISTTVAVILCADLDNTEMFNKEVKLSGTFKDDKAILKVVKKLIDDENVQALQVVDMRVEKALYVMPEQQFIELAEKKVSRE